MASGAAIPPDMQRQADVHVQLTNDSSILSKASTVNFGYFDDPFVKHFIEEERKLTAGGKEGKAGAIPRRAPLIHRGYAIRYLVVDSLIDRLVKAKERPQILLLGCGFDSLYFRMRAGGRLQHVSKFVELDFPDLMRRKKLLIDQSGLEESREEDPSFHAYVGADLKKLGDVWNQLNQLEEGFFQRPTIILAEVVLTYLPTREADAVLAWISKSFADASVVLYEQILPSTSFGHVMKKHFCSRNSPIFPLDDYPTVEAQEQRCLNLGFQQAQAQDLLEFLHRNLGLDMLRRWREIEPFDEFEEWHTKLQHYFTLVATTKMNDDLGGRVLDGLFASPAAAAARRLPETKVEDFRTWPSPLLARYGHAGVVRAEEKPSLVAFGGFAADQQGRHGRTSDVVVSDTVRGSGGECLGEIPAAPMFARMIQSKRKFYVVGGRAGPMRPRGEIVGFELKEAGAEKSEVLSFAPLARWRHGAELVPGEREAVCVFGGRIPDAVLDDIVFCFVDDPPSSHLLVSRHRLPTPRHSFASCFIPQADSASTLGTLYLFGGLDADENFLDEVVEITLRKPFGGLVEEAEDQDPVVSVTSHQLGVPLYGAVATPHSDYILLTGGISTCRLTNMVYRNKNAVQVIAWNARSRQIEKVLNCDLGAEVFLPWNHQAGVGEDGSLVVFGGGGNCFSFGTHLNEELLSLNLNCL